MSKLPSQVYTKIKTSGDQYIGYIVYSDTPVWCCLGDYTYVSFKLYHYICNNTMNFYVGM